MAVIKANAYGHGAVAVAQALSPEADAFGVACIEEAIQLRTAGVTNPILLLEGVFERQELPVVVELGLWTVVHSLEQLDWLLHTDLTSPLTVWLKLDSGMHRLGLAPAEYRKAHNALLSCGQVAEVVQMSHLARADELSCDATQAQRLCFEAATQGQAGERSLHNSAGLMGWPARPPEWVRPGLMLYGVSPLDRETAAGSALEPVMSLESALIAVHELQAGEAIGYGAAYVTPHAMRIGVVAMGYGDGYPRSAPAGTPVAVNGKRTSVVGRVSMDMLTVDLTGLDARPGDPVELWGRTIALAEVARAAGTIPYELVTRMPARVPRLYGGSAGAR